MAARVLFFGATADIVKSRELEIPVSDVLTTNAVLEHLLKQFPSLAGHKLHISLNQQYSNGGEAVRDGDEIAVFTAVSGG